ncbi:hypothetical protein Tco_1418091 [Tanacetum coccineum]
MYSDDAVKDSKEVAGVHKQKVLEEPNSTKVEVKQEGHEEKEEQLKAFLKIVPDEEGIIDYEVLDKRSDGSSRWIKTFFEMVTRFDRLDLVELYDLVMKKFETTTPEGVDLVLWGDLRTMFNANAKDELWQNQERWNLKSWDLYENCCVHTLILEDGTEIHMLAERKYPLTKETLERMLSLSKELASPKQTALALAIPEQTATGKEISNPFMAGFRVKEFDEPPTKEEALSLSVNLVILEKSSTSLMLLLIICTNYGEPLHQSSTNVSVERYLVLIRFDFQEFKSYMECTTRRIFDFVTLILEDLAYQIDNIDSKKQDKMFYPRFTKIIIHHFPNKDKSISMRNRTFMHTAHDDSLLGTMRFVSRHADSQVYGAILPEAMMNQALLNYVAYKTYYAIALGVEPPKSRKGQKKLDSAISSEESPYMKKYAKAKKVVATKPKQTKKKVRVKADRGKGLNVLSEVALSKDAELKEVTKRSKKDFHISHESGSGVSDVPTYDSESEKESWGDSGEEDDDDEKDSKDKSDDGDDDDDDGNDGNDGNGDYDDDANDDDNQEDDDMNDDNKKNDSDKTKSDIIKIHVFNQSSTEY